MRLRPSGTKGPIASTLEGFIQYHSSSAWTWEQMALTRARALLGPKDLRRRIDEAIRDVLRVARDPVGLLRDVADMRRRLNSEHGSTSLWALKNLRGGIVDIEFIAQYLTLRHAHGHPEILGHDTRGTLAALMEAGLLDRDSGDRLIDASGLWQGLQGLLALTIEGEITEERVEEIPSALKEDLVRVGGGTDFAALEDRIRATADAVYAIFKDIIEDPAPPGGTGG